MRKSPGRKLFGKFNHLGLFSFFFATVRPCLACQTCAKSCPSLTKNEVTDETEISSSNVEDASLELVKRNDEASMIIESEENEDQNLDYNYDLHSWSRPHLRGKDLVPKCAIACSVICEKPVQSCALCIHKTCKGSGPFQLDA